MALHGTQSSENQLQRDDPDARPAPADGLLVDRDSAVDPALSVVMPTLNEEAGIAECIDRIKTAIEEYGIVTEIIISDSSTDRTPEIARERGALVVEPDEPGYGYAYRYAFERAAATTLRSGMPTPRMISRIYRAYWSRWLTVVRIW